MQQTKIESIIPLNDLQKALLLHNLQASDDRGFLHMQFTMKGKLDEELLKEAWEKGISRHAVMRTSVHWQNISKSVQLVHPSAPLPWASDDWRDRSDEQFQQDFLQFLTADRAEGLPLSKAPISRFHLFRKTEDVYHFVWTCHHILLDGWGALIILQDVFAYYDAMIKGESIFLPQPPSYQSYLNWLKTHDQAVAEAFWQEQLQGYTHPTLIQQLAGGRVMAETDGAFRDHFLIISKRNSQTLTQLAHQLGVSVNILIKGIWAMVLSICFDRDDVLFGMTISGRSGGFYGLELMADQVMNFIPVRVQIQRDAPLKDWLRGLQKNQIELNRYEHIDINQILSWIAWPGHTPIFDSLLVFQGWPWEELESGELVVQNLKGSTTSIHPLNVKVKQAEHLEFQFHYNSGEIAESVILALSDLLNHLIDGLYEGDIATPHQILNRCERPEFLIPTAPKEDQLPERRTHLSEVVAPTTRLEADILEIWKAVLGQPIISITDDFFEVGGTSLLAVDMFARMEKQLGKVIPPVSLLDHSSIQALANLIEGDTKKEEKWSPLIAIQPKGTRPPFFAIHGVGGNIFTYRDLTKQLGEDQPVYGLQALGLDGKTKSPDTMEELATWYIQEIQKVQPQGPYLLGGISFGGLLAFEISKQLVAKRYDVPILALFDTLSNPSQSSILAQRVPWRYRIVERLDLHIGHLLMVGYRKKFRYLIDKVKEAVRVRLRPETKTLYHNIKNANEVFIVNNQIAKSYELTPYDGKITLFLAEKNYMRFYQDLRLAWHQYANKGLEIHIVPGDHGSMMKDPHVEVLAKKLAACIDRIDD